MTQFNTVFDILVKWLKVDPTYGEKLLEQELYGNDLELSEIELKGTSAVAELNERSINIIKGITQSDIDELKR